MPSGEVAFRSPAHASITRRSVRHGDEENREKVERQLAQVTLSRLRYPVDSPRLGEFVAALGEVNRLAERSPGFVWRLESAAGHLNGAEALGDPLAVVTVSVWADYPSLHAYVYRSRHGHFVSRRDRWFERLPTPTTALWWIEAGQRPTVEEALARLAHLRAYGPTPRAFTVRRRFTAYGEREPRTTASP